MKKISIKVETLYDVVIDYEDFMLAFEKYSNSSKEFRKTLYGLSFNALFQNLENEDELKLFDLKRYWEAIVNDTKGFYKVDGSWVNFEIKEHTDIINTIAKVLGFDGVQFYGYKKGESSLKVTFKNNGCDL